MEKFNFNEEAKKNEQSGFLKIKEGANRMRIISKSVKRVSEYDGKPTIKFLTHVIDRGDGKLKIYSMPYVILKMIGDLQMQEDYSFDTVPMPYDITVSATNAGKLEVSYSVTPARANSELTEVELEEIKKLKPIEQVVAELMSKEHPSTLEREMPPHSDEDIRPEDLPY